MPSHLLENTASAYITVTWEDNLHNQNHHTHPPPTFPLLFLPSTSPCSMEYPFRGAKRGGKKGEGGGGEP